MKEKQLMMSEAYVPAEFTMLEQFVLNQIKQPHDDYDALLSRFMKLIDAHDGTTVYPRYFSNGVMKKILWEYKKKFGDFVYPQQRDTISVADIVRPIPDAEKPAFHDFCIQNTLGHQSSASKLCDQEGSESGTSAEQNSTRYADGERLILELPGEKELGVGWASDIIITTKRITTNGNTFTLEGVKNVRFERFRRVDGAKEFWLGVMVFVIGLLFVANAGKSGIVGTSGTIGMGTMLVGTMWAWGNRRSKRQSEWNGKIVLEYSATEKSVCYEMDLGFDDLYLLTLSKSYSEQWIEKHGQSRRVRFQRMQLIAEKIGAAIGHN